MASYADIATIVGVHLNVYLDYIKAEFTCRFMSISKLISCCQYMPSTVFLVLLFIHKRNGPDLSHSLYDCFPASVIQERKRSPTTPAGRDRHRAQLSGTAVDHHFGCVFHCVGSGYFATGHLLRCSGCHRKQPGWKCQAQTQMIVANVLMLP